MSTAMALKGPPIRVQRSMTVIKRPASTRSQLLKAREAKERYDGEGCLDLECGSCKALVYKDVLYSRVREFAVECNACEAINVI